VRQRHRARAARRPADRGLHRAALRDTADHAAPLPVLNRGVRALLKGKAVGEEGPDLLVGAAEVLLARATATAPAAATAAAGASAAERTSVGAYAITGNPPCPASRLWRVQESDALDGTGWFAAGSLLPAATFTVPARSFGKTSNTPMAINRRGTRQLARRESTLPGA
jgi:hypothetical protein